MKIPTLYTASQMICLQVAVIGPSDILFKQLFYFLKLLLVPYFNQQDITVLSFIKNVKRATYHFKIQSCNDNTISPPVALPSGMMVSPCQNSMALTPGYRLSLLYIPGWCGQAAVYLNTIMSSKQDLSSCAQTVLQKSSAGLIAAFLLPSVQIFTEQSRVWFNSSYVKTR